MAHTVYVPILRISKHGVQKSPDIKPRPTMSAAQMVLDTLESICIKCGWKVEYAGIGEDIQDNEPDYRAIDMLLEAEVN